MMFLFRVLGSLSCAIVLIATTIVFVVAGTLIESVAHSHLYAAKFTYHNPFFQILLWLYFVNILFSALNRYPFRKKHIPFLVTHLGLLLLLSGVFVKNHFGIQGSCALAEGNSTSQIFLPNTYALHLETPEGYILLNLHEKKLGPLPEALGLTLSVLEWHPHAEEHLEGFIKGKWGHILGLPPFPLTQLQQPEFLRTAEYQICAVKNVESQEIEFPGNASLFFIQDSEMRESLIAFNSHGERYETPLTREWIYIYNKGYGGYGIQAELPKHFPPLELITPMTRSWKKFKHPPQKKEEAKPYLKLFVQTKEHAEQVSLSYDKFAQGFKWPILGGKYLIRFQSAKKQIPYNLRLIRAEQTNYPGTDRPYSYEAALKINQEEVLLSMNHVYENKGFRFYLSNLLMSPSGISQIQIVINHDPAKYFFTYPGGLFVVLGALLLFFKREVKNN